MSRTLKNRILFLPLFLVSAAGAAFGQYPGGDAAQDYARMAQQAMQGGNYAQTVNWDARLKVLSGTVLARIPGEENWVKITGELPLDPGDAVKTSADGVAELYLESRGVVSIGRNTELKFPSLSKSETIFSLNTGSLVAKVRQFSDAKAKLRVRTPSAVCAVKGTEFAVEYSRLRKDTSVAVFDEGRVTVTQDEETGSDTQEYTLEKNTEISLTASKGRFRAVPLSRMSRYRGTLGTVRSRAAALKSWTSLSRERRAELRRRAFAPRPPRGDGKGKARNRSGAKAAAARRAKARRQAQAAEETLPVVNLGEGR